MHPSQTQYPTPPTPPHAPFPPAWGEVGGWGIWFAWGVYMHIFLESGTWMKQFRLIRI